MLTVKLVLRTASKEHTLVILTDINVIVPKVLQGIMRCILLQLVALTVPAPSTMSVSNSEQLQDLSPDEIPD